jgi:hypothetical protein
MADKKFTFLEFHLHDSDLQFGPEMIGDVVGSVGGDAGTEESGDEPTGQEVEVEGDDGSCPGRTVGKLLLVLVAVVAVVVAAKKLLGGDEELSELEELDESV